MVSLRRKLKQLLIDKQHRIYEEKAVAKNLTYDSWIREKEREIANAHAITLKNKKSLTNDLKMEGNDRGISEDEGKNARGISDCRIVQVIDKNSQNQGKMKFLITGINLFCNNIDALLNKYDSDIVLILQYEGEINEIAYPLLYERFSKNDKNLLIYGDEDTRREVKRENPWFKPDWSPDRFMSCFYFGALVAVRRSALREAYVSGMKDNRIVPYQPEKEAHNALRWLYRLLFEMLLRKGGFAKGHEAAQNPVFHVRQVLYHNRSDGYEQIKDCHLPKEAKQELLCRMGTLNPKAAKESAPLLSIIIPSKDNPGALFCCLDSLMEKTCTSTSFEIILVDNGSREENRKKIQEKVKSLKWTAGEDAAGEDGGIFKGCRYLYRPMPFNFSKMCNLGAQESKGALLLFLNDDMEIIQPNWMELLVQKAELSYVGAVGAKLLYPDSDIIQHAGITNLRIGPAHKLQFLSDKKVHYFGKNRGVHNMLAATGACLMMRKSVFEEAGGFYEGLAVAFNDVDLCYTIYGLGYYNIARNDVTLYHHESLSRGKDGESEEKQLRLIRENEILYQRQYNIYGKDPFYHPYLTTDILESEYSPLFHYQITPDMPCAEVVLCKKALKHAREDKCLVVGMECAMDIFKRKYAAAPEKVRAMAASSEKGFYFQGYAFVIGADNACYKRHLLLKNKENGQVWSVAVDDRYRQDIKNNLEDQINVELTGFAARIYKEDIPLGVYQFGMLAEDKCSRQKLVNWSNWVLEVGEDEE